MNMNCCKKDMNDKNVQSLIYNEKDMVASIDKKLLRMKLGGFNTYGMTQEFYSQKNQRLAGCGPTAASNMIYYLYKNQKLSQELSKKIFKERDFETDIKRLMNLSWNYITPGAMGVHSTEIFRYGFKRIIEDYNLDYDVENFVVPRKITIMKTEDILVESRNFIKEGLDEGAPIAFLNLINKSNVDTWHWVSIVSIEGNTVEIFDGYHNFKEDISKWIKNRYMGGGFVRLKKLLPKY